MEQADSCDSGRSSLEAGRRVFHRHAAKRIDRNRSGGHAGFAQTIEPLAGKRRAAGNRLLKYGREEDGVDAMTEGANDFSKRMAGHRHHRSGQLHRVVKAPHLSWVEFAGRRGKVHAMRARGSGYIGTGVHQEPRVAGTCGNRLQQIAGKTHQICGGQILFAELNETNAVGSPARSLFEQRGPLSGIVSGKQAAAGDGVAKHDDFIV